MANLLETIQELCAKRNVTIAQLERECGLGNATIKKWDTSVPSADKLARIADYFNVSVDFLLGRTEIDGVYLSLAKEAEKNGIDPDDIIAIINTLKKYQGGR